MKKIKAWAVVSKERTVFWRAAYTEGLAYTLGAELREKKVFDEYEVIPCVITFTPTKSKARNKKKI